MSEAYGSEGAAMTVVWRLAAAAIVLGVIAAVVAVPANPAFAAPACPASLGGYPLDPRQGTVTDTGIEGHYSLVCGYGNPYEYDPDRTDFQAIVSVQWAEAPVTGSPAIKCGTWFNPDSLGTPNDVTPGEEIIEWVVYYDTVDQHYLNGAATMVEVNFKVFDEFPLDTARALGFELFAAAAEEAAPCPGDGPNQLGVTDVAANVSTEFGVIVEGDFIFLNSAPGETLNISRDDLPAWARDLLVTTGAIYARAGPAGWITGGDDQVLLDGLPVARIGDPTNFGGIILEGSTLIFINGQPAATVGSMVIDGTLLPLVPGIGGPILLGECDPNRRVNHMGQSICVDTGVAVLEEAVQRGDVRIMLDGDGEFEIGDGLIIGDDEETADTAVVADKGSLILDRPLQYDHAAGSALIRIPAEYVDQVIADVPRAAQGPDGTQDTDGIPTGVMILAGLLVAAAGVVWHRRNATATREPPPPPPPPPV